MAQVASEMVGDALNAFSARDALLAEAVVQRDLNTLLGIVFVSALLVILVNFLVDLAYARLDPRIGAGR